MSCHPQTDKRTWTEKSIAVCPYLFQRVHNNTTLQGGVLHKIFSRRVQQVITNWTQLDLRFCKMRGQKI